jgi:hypothetical protein
MGTVESVVVFYNHHTHRLVESWQDEMFHEKTPPDAGEANTEILKRAFHNDPKVTP